MPTLYHYTDELSLEKIIKSGFIKASTDETLDCAFGKGVYLTSLNPSDNDKATVAQNNYDGRWRTGIMAGKVNAYLEITIPSGDPKLRQVYGERDIYLYEGNLNLLNFNCIPGHKKNKTVRSSPQTFAQLAASTARPPLATRRLKRLQRASVVSRSRSCLRGWRSVSQPQTGLGNRTGRQTPQTSLSNVNVRQTPAMWPAIPTLRQTAQISVPNMNARQAPRMATANELEPPPAMWTYLAIAKSLKNRHNRHSKSTGAIIGSSLVL